VVASPLEKNGVRVKGREGPALVFGNGFGTDQRAWRFVAPPFEASHRVVLFDHVGFGASDIARYDASRHSTLDGYAQDLVELIEALALRGVVYVGHSIGGVLGLLASIARPELFAQLVLLGSSPRFINDPPHYHGGFEAHEVESILALIERDQLTFAQSLAPLAMGTQSPAPLVDDFSAGLQRLDPLVARRFGRLVFGVDCRDRLAQVTVPALVLQCLHDSIAPRGVGQYLHRHLAGSTLVELDASGHCPHLSHPQQTLAVLGGLLGRPDA
jgi:sigma-B regulation protein RsbQ